MKREELLKRTKKELLALAGEEGARLSARLRKSELVDQLISLISTRGARKARRKTGTVKLKSPSPRSTNGSPRSSVSRTNVPSSNGALSPKELREISQEISRHFPLPFDRTEIVLLDVDPFHAHVFWHVRLDDMETGRKSLGTEGEHAALLLRVYDVTLIDFDGNNAHLTFDVAVHSLHSHRYFDFWESGRAYIVDIGLLPQNGPFLTLARSNPMQLPPSAPSNNFDRSGVVVDPQGNIVCEVADITRARTLADIRPEPRPDMEPDTSDNLVRSFYRQLTDGNSQGASRPRRKASSLGEFRAAPDGAANSASSSTADDEAETTAIPQSYSNIRAEQHAASAQEQESGGARNSVSPARFRLTRSSDGSQAEEIFLTVHPPHGFESSYAVSQELSKQHLSSWANPVKGVSSWVTSPGAGGSRESTLEGVLIFPPEDLKKSGAVSEIFADLVIEGRADPGSQFSLLGETVRLRPDGTFSLRRRVPDGTMLMPLPAQHGQAGVPEPKEGSS